MHPEIAPARPLSSQMKSGLQTVTLYFQKPVVFLRFYKLVLNYKKTVIDYFQNVLFFFRKTKES